MNFPQVHVSNANTFQWATKLHKKQDMDYLLP